MPRKSIITYFSGTDQVAVIMPVPIAPAPLEPTEQPTILGTVREGQTVSAGAPEWPVTVTVTESGWEVLDTDLTTVLDSSTSATYAIATGGTYAGKYLVRYVEVVDLLGRTARAEASAVIVAAQNAPAWVTAPVLSGTGNVGDTITLANGTYTGTEPVTLAQLFYADGVLIAGQTDTTFPPDSSYNGKIITAFQTASNALGSDVLSAVSNGITVVDATAPPFPSFADDNWSYSELQTGEEGRLEFTIGNDVLDTDFNYYILTRAVDDLPADPAAQGQLIAASSTYIRAAKPVGTLVYPKIVAIRIEDGAFETVATKQVYTILGIDDPVTPASTPLQDFPAPAAGYLADAMASITGATTRVRYFTNGAADTNAAYRGSIITTIALAAYKGDTTAQTELLAHLNLWRGIEGPDSQGGYHAQHNLYALCSILIAEQTPAVWNQLTATQQEGLLLNVLGATLFQVHMLSSANPDNNNIAMRGRDGGIGGGNEPNIAAGNYFTLVMGLARYGAAAIQAEVDDFNKTTFRNRCNTNGNCPNLVRTLDWATVGTANTATVPTAAEMVASMRPTGGWRSETGNFTLAQFQSMFERYLGRCFGLTSAGVEQSGNLGARVCHAGVFWVSGNAPGADIAPKSGTTSLPDNGFGVPVRNGDGSYDKNGAGTAFTDRRGVPTNSNFGNLAPFIGQSGCISEMNSVDAGGQRASSSYSLMTFRVFAQVAFAIICMGKGPDNLQPNNKMTTGWTETEPTIDFVATSTGGMRSTSCFRYIHAGGTGFTGQLEGQKFPVTAGSQYLVAGQTLRVSGTTYRVRLQAKWYNASNVEVTPKSVVFDAAVTTTGLNERGALVTAPTGATQMALVWDVDKSATDGTVHFGGPVARNREVVKLDWNTVGMRTLLPRARRGILFARAVANYGWLGLAKANQSGGSNRETWTAAGQGATWRWDSTHGLGVDLLPYFRQVVTDFPPYGNGYTGFDWESVVNFTY